jgi:hypothetical protein
MIIIDIVLIVIYYIVKRCTIKNTCSLISKIITKKISPFEYFSILIAKCSFFFMQDLIKT